ncbi:MAG: MMPL family transporter, partial [Acidobacteria bacterium]|nr:MMPL family transporter [Acidobacteriota bacterium]
MGRRRAPPPGDRLDELVPAAFGDEGSARALVAGATAGNIDFKDMIIFRMPIVFAFVLGLAFLILLVMFRSIVIPIKAILLNLLSVGAAYGVLVLVFQEGWLLEGLLDFEATEGAFDIAFEPDQLAGILESLTSTLNEEISERQVLAQQLRQLQAEVEELQMNRRVIVEDASSERVVSLQAMEDRFTEMGFTWQDRESIRHLQAVTQVRAVELNDLAR